MDETNHVIKRITGYAVENESSPFEKTLPQEPFKLPKQPKSIIYKTKAGSTQVITIKKENKHLNIIFKACSIGFKSHWFSGLSDRSKPVYFDSVRKYFDWTNKSGHNTTKKTRYDTLKLFETYLLNDLELKSSPLKFINKVIEAGMTCSTISDEEHGFLQTLISVSKPEKNLETSSYTLSGWFDLPWLRSIIGDKSYLQLESPRILFNSFRITIATTLLYFLDQRERWEKSSIIKFDISQKGWQYDWNRKLLERDGKFNKEGNPEDAFSQLLWLDLVKPSGQEVLKARLKKEGSHSLSKRLYYQKTKIIPWQKPIFFHPSYQEKYSHIEELLCAWLIACEAIQPTDISKLKTNNYARECNSLGRLIAMECTYYKGRSGTTKQPTILMGGDPWTKAIDQYTKGLSGSHLFTKNIAKAQLFPSLKKHSYVSLLLSIWKLPAFQKKLEPALQRAKTTPLFLHAMLALEQHDESYSQFYNRTGKSADEYRKLTSRKLPTLLFSLTHIKNTAVYAETDSYRAEDLINYHSHTALTEKTSYLTDQNKEWVNQAGRITRLVLHDLQNVVFQPSITAISQSVYDLELRTRLIAATHTSNIVIHSMNSGHLESESDGTIIVSDTSDTALYFIHYINQAESALPKLLKVRPYWVERTLIVQVEWMTRTLTRMRTTATAQKTYKKLEAYLPPLFDHLLESME